MFRRYGFGLALALWAVSAMPLRAEMRVSSDDALRAVVKKTEPEYPPMARQMRIGGKVTVEVTVDVDGSVVEAKVASGNALLTPTVLNAVKKWKFTPFNGSNGEPTRAVATIDFDFKL